MDDINIWRMIRRELAELRTRYADYEDIKNEENNNNKVPSQVEIETIVKYSVYGSKAIDKALEFIDYQITKLS